MFADIVETEGWLMRAYGRISLAMAALLLAAGAPAHAEVQELRFARNVGLGYLPLYVMEEQKLVEQQAAKRGLGAVKATYRIIPGPGAINDALLSGNADFGIAGIQGMIIAWDRTRGHNEIKGLAPIGTNPAYLNTNDPDLRDLRALNDKERIALPTVKVSSQAYALEYASEALYGAGHYDRFDHLTVSLSHPNAVAALLSGSGGITAHFATAPYYLLELQDPKIHTVTTDGKIYGRSPTSTAIWTTTRFHDRNPRLCAAVLASLEQADAFIKAHPAEAARIFIKIDHANFPPELVEKALADLSYGTAPEGIQLQAEFMHHVGAIKQAPKSWKELFFDDVENREGS